MKIRNLSPKDDRQIEQIIQLLMESFAAHWPNYCRDRTSALTEIENSFQVDHISRIAIDEQEQVLGWIGGSPHYDGHVWELHPLCVHPAYRGQGIGRALVADLEQQVHQRGGSTLWVATDDEDEMTSVGGIDLYPQVLAHLAELKNYKRHPYEFYQKCGFVLVGIMPDANGKGKPDLYLAKSVQ